MKKILSLLLVFSMLLVMLCSCSQSNSTQNTTSSETTSTTEDTSSKNTDVDISENVVTDESSLSIADATATELSITLDGTTTKITMYEDVYVGNPTNVAMVPTDGVVDQTLSMYVPENATGESPIILWVKNWGWIQDAYALRNTVEDGGEYTSDSETDVFGKAFSKGYVVITYGCRSRGDNATEDGKYVSHSPATVTDTKAVIRYLRYNQSSLPAGNSERIVVTGLSGGGALSTIIASSGNSEDYFESLYEVGAAGIVKNEDGSYTSELGDDVFATICYCPINDLREADAAYEYTYKDTRQRLIDDGLPVVDEETGLTFQDPFTDTYTEEWMMTASEALAEQYGEYVNALGLSDEDGNTITADNLRDEMRLLINAGMKKAYNEIGLDKMLDDLKGDALYSDVETTKMFNSTSDGWTDFLSYDEDGVPYLADEAALEDYLYFVARNQTLKVACAFSNKGLSEEGLASTSGYNEDSLFGTEEYPYSSYEFYSWNNDAVAGNGCGLDDTGLTWDEYMETDEGKQLAMELQMASPIPYLTSDTNGISAKYWYVRHGLRDRDTSFALQTVLYYALLNDDSIENLNFALTWLQPHAGDYDVQEAYEWLDTVLAEAE